jgi:hypothetical protein
VGRPNCNPWSNKKLTSVNFVSVDRDAVFHLHANAFHEEDIGNRWIRHRFFKTPISAEKISDNFSH